MAQYFTDFSEYTTDSAPGDWTYQYELDAGLWIVRSVSGATGGKVLRLDTTLNSRKGISWDLISNTNYQNDGELVFRFRFNGTPSGQIRGLTRAKHDPVDGSNDVDGYWANRQDDGSLSFGYYDVANNTTVSSVVGTVTGDTWYWLRFQYRGDNFKVRTWPDANTEPTVWDIESTQTVVTAEQVIGLFNFGGGNVDIDVFGAGTGTDPAPTSASTGADHALDATDIQSATQVSSPSISQVHDLTANDAESASTVSSPTLTQKHSLDASNVSSATSVSAPALSETHILDAADISSATQVSSPALSQAHSLDASNIQSATSVGTPAITQVHSLNANDLSSATQVSNPSLSSGVDHSLSAQDVQSASSVSTPTLTQTHGLQASSVSSITEVGIPQLQQVHDLTGQPITSATEVSSPSLTEIVPGTEVDARELTIVYNPVRYTFASGSPVFTATKTTPRYTLHRS